MSDEGAVYGTFIEAEAKAERERRSTIDQRGSAVVTSSGAFVALALALTAAWSGDGAALRSEAQPLFLAGVAGLVTASLAAVLATLNLTYQVAGSKTLHAMTEERWDDTTADARAAVASLHVGTLDALRRTNAIKARMLFVALCAQTAAVVLLGTAIAVQMIAT